MHIITIMLFFVGYVYRVFSHFLTHTINSSYFNRTEFHYVVEPQYEFDITRNLPVPRPCRDYTTGTLHRTADESMLLKIFIS